MAPGHVMVILGSVGSFTYTVNGTAELFSFLTTAVRHPLTSLMVYMPVSMAGMIKLQPVILMEVSGTFTSPVECIGTRYSFVREVSGRIKSPVIAMLRPGKTGKPMRPVIQGCGWFTISLIVYVRVALLCAVTTYCVPVRKGTFVPFVGVMEALSAIMICGATESGNGQ